MFPQISRISADSGVKAGNRVWNCFIAELGWRDERSHVLPQRIEESGLTGKPIKTLIDDIDHIDHIEFDEARDPVAARAWEKI